MIITKLRLEEEHPMTSPVRPYPLPIVDLNLDSSAGDNGFTLNKSSGLGPPTLTKVVTGFDTNGIPIFDNVPQKRQIGLKISITPRLGQEFGDLRDQLYKMVSRSIFIRFMNGAEIIAQTTGFIKNIVPDMFTPKPEIVLDIECNEGDLKGPNAFDIPIATLNTLTPVINYEKGSAPTGLDLTYAVTATHSGFTISNHAEFWHVGDADVNNQFIVSYTFLNGDIITLSTHPRNKRLIRTRSGVDLDLAGYINPGAVWPKLYSGVNSFSWTFASSWGHFTAASYIPRYWGV